MIGRQKKTVPELMVKAEFMVTRCANAIRFLAIDAIARANSGHPGMPMGMADIAEVLWRRFLRHNPKNPHWPNRDRFVLSNGHGSMLLYSLLHLTGYDLSINDIQHFRQLGAKTPGHPEYGRTPGVETTTGPLGQGIANAVGMALAEKLLAAQFNQDHHTLVDHTTWVFAGDGCLMEGISHEACSLAGTLKLNKLIVFWDDNGISIDGNTQGWFDEDTATRFEAYHWHVIRAVDGHDPTAIAAAIQAAQSQTTRPTLICCKTVIGYGSPNQQGTSALHGMPLSSEEIAATREHLNWHYPPFVVPDDIYQAWDACARGQAAEKTWQQSFDNYAKAYPGLAQEFVRRMAGELPQHWAADTQQAIATINQQAQTTASRKASQQAIKVLATILPELVGGSADLTASNLTQWPDATVFSGEKGGNYIHYGVREFAMAAIMNGIALHGGFKPFGGTFLMFSDYARNALRMAALMKISPIFVLTHDSIGVGEDGPTHQPIEQLASLRCIPNMDLWRPCDTVECMVAWTAAVKTNDRPSALVLSRQDVPFVIRTPAQIDAIRYGGYVVAEANHPQAVIMATGSEVALALATQQALAAEGLAIRVVSMPCTQVFDRQSADYIAAVLPAGLPRVAIEAGHPDFWRKYVGLNGAVVGIDHFGESAPAAVLFPAFGFEVASVAEQVRQVLGG